MHFEPVKISDQSIPPQFKSSFDILSPLEILFSLRNTPISDVFLTPTWMKLLSVAGIEHLAKGTRLHNSPSQNAPCFLLVQGAARLWRDGKISRIRRIATGTLFFESSNSSPQIVEITQDSIALRIERHHYHALLEPYLVQCLNHNAAQHDLATCSNARVLDVREPSEFQESHIPGALNLSLESVYENVEALNQNIDWIVVSNRDTRAREAATFLIQHGFLARVL